MMEKASSLAGELEGKQRELDRVKGLIKAEEQISAAEVQQVTLESKLGQAHSELSKAQDSCKQAESAFGQSLTEKNKVNDELQAQKKFFSVLSDLSNKYSKFEGITVNPAIVMTEKLSAEELAHSSVLQVTCKEQCPEAFDAALLKITDLNIQDLDGRTILMHAIINGFYYGVGKLLARNADVNLLDRQGSNALIHSAAISHIRYTKLIADKTHDLNHKAAGISNNTAVYNLVRNTHNVLYADELLDGLQDVSDVLYHGGGNLIFNVPMTLSCLAVGFRGDGFSTCQEKILRILDYLVSKGADINVQNDEGVTAFFLACALKLKYLLKQMIDRYQIDWTLLDSCGYNALQFVLELRDKELVKQVLDKEVNINHQNKEGKTALILSAENMLVDIVDLLFNTYNASDLPNKNGFTAWDIATLNAYSDVIKVMIAKKNITADSVQLWCAARKGIVSEVEELLNTGIDPDITIGSFKNSTPLIQAVINHRVPVIESLLKHKANINKADNEEASPLYYSLGYARQTVDQNIVKLLLVNGANVNQPMADGDTPLHMASYLANVSAMKILLNNGAIVDEKNIRGKTPLDGLIEMQGLEEENKLAAVKYLLLNSTFPLHKDKEGKNAIDLAKKYFPAAVPWLEHPENLPASDEFEASIISMFSDLLS